MNTGLSSLKLCPLLFYFPVQRFFLFSFFPFFLVKQKTAYEISECDWSSDVCSSDRFFFFKQKTAYEISECDWSSDVCSSDRPPPACRQTSCMCIRAMPSRQMPTRPVSCFL